MDYRTGRGLLIYYVEPNDDQHISVGVMKQLCGGDTINARDLESSPNKEAIELFCNTSIQSAHNNYCLFVDNAYRRFMERNEINMNEIMFRMLLHKNGWRGKKLISSDE